LHRQLKEPLMLIAFFSQKWCSFFKCLLFLQWPPWGSQ
jgi:hypothetical protein